MKAISLLMIIYTCSVAGRFGHPAEGDITADGIDMRTFWDRARAGNSNLSISVVVCP